MIMPKNLFALDKVPDFGGQVAPFPIDPPVVEHPAELVDRAFEERLLLVGQCRRRGGKQLRPVGIAGKKSASHQTSPASSASRSVSDIAGNTPRAQEKIGLVMMSRRKA